MWLVRTIMAGEDGLFDKDLQKEAPWTASISCER